MLLNCFGRDLIRFSRLLRLPVYWHKLHVTTLGLNLHPSHWLDSFKSHLFTAALRRSKYFTLTQPFSAKQEPQRFTKARSETEFT